MGNLFWEANGQLYFYCLHDIYFCAIIASNEQEVHLHESLVLIEADKIDTTPLITHRYKLEDIEAAYHLFENKLDGVIKVAVEV